MPTRRHLDETILPGHRLIRTDQPETMRAFLAELHNAPRFEIRPAAGSFAAQANRAQIGHTVFDYCAYDADVNVEFPEATIFRQLICLFGSGEVTLGRARVRLAPNDSCVIPPRMNTTVRYAPGYRQLILRLDPESLRSKLEALIGAPAARGLDFERSAAARTPQLGVLQETALFYARQLAPIEAQLPEVVKNEFEQALLTACLWGNRHNFSFLLDKPAKSATPREIWLVEAYVEANWNKPITIEEIASMTGVSARSIFQSFKEKRGYSPMAFVKTIRLERANEMLRRPESDVSVTGVAFACGFHSHGHFSRDYRERFGELPSQTLARSRVE